MKKLLKFFFKTKLVSSKQKNFPIKNPKKKKKMKIKMKKNLLSKKLICSKRFFSNQYLFANLDQEKQNKISDLMKGKKKKKNL